MISATNVLSRAALAVAALAAGNLSAQITIDQAKALSERTGAPILAFAGQKT